MSDQAWGLPAAAALAIGYGLGRLDGYLIHRIKECDAELARLERAVAASSPPARKEGA